MSRSKTSTVKKKNNSRSATSSKKHTTKSAKRKQSTKRRGPGRPPKKKTATRKQPSSTRKSSAKKKQSAKSRKSNRKAAPRNQTTGKRRGPGRPPKKKTATKKSSKKAGRSSRKSTSRTQSPAKQKKRPGRPPKKKTTRQNKKSSTSSRTANYRRQSKKQHTPETNDTNSSKPSEETISLLLDEIKNIKKENERLYNKIDSSATTPETVTSGVQEIQKNAGDQKNNELIKEVEHLEESLENNNVSKNNILSKLKNIMNKEKSEEENQDSKTEDEDKKTQEQTKETEQENEDTISFSTNEILQEENKEEQEQSDSSEQESNQDTIDPKDYQSDKKSGVISLEKCELYSEALKQVINEIAKVFVGQTHVTKRVMLSLMCDAHTLMEGVPGLAKTLLVETLNKTISGTTFKRIQFLPDLLPADVIGGQIYNPKTAKFTTYKGPIFANFVLADEINRAPPKTHAAVMEAMQEKKINIENDQFILDRPFLVLATQNPLENKGTYSLPEAVLDRFMFKVDLNYPERDDELKIITENATTKSQTIHKQVHQVLSKKELLEIQSEVKNVYLSQKIRTYILDIVEATRGKNKNIEGTRFIKYGAGVRASIYLGAAAKAKAMMEGRNYVLPDDIKFVAPAILRHRISMNYRGKAHNISSDKIIEEVLSKVDAI